MTAPLDALLPQGAQELVARRYQAVTGFLAERELDPGWLSSLMRDWAGDGELLLTSSPVHGLANETSDLDFIRIQQDMISGPRISAKLFERGHHLEVVSFSAAELKQALDELDVLASQPPAKTVAGYRSWDKRLEPRRKQTERIVNGLTLDGTAPYLDGLPALAIVWSRAALQAAIEQAVHLSLAESAGELRGRVGYACNVLLHLMDCLLSVHGDVYTTRKWYLLRWTRHVRQENWRSDEHRWLGAAVEQARRSLAGALTSPEPIAPGYADLVASVAEVIGAGPVRVRMALADDAEYHDYLPGAGMLSAPGGAILVPRRPDFGDSAWSLPVLPGMAREDAASRLLVVRSGIGQVITEYGDRRSR